MLWRTITEKKEANHGERTRQDCFITFGLLSFGIGSKEILVLTEEKKKAVKHIFISDSPGAGGWWQVIKAAFELADREISNPDSREKMEEEVTSNQWNEVLHCSHCQAEFRIKVEATGSSATAGNSKGDVQVGQKGPGMEGGWVKFENQMLIVGRQNNGYQNTQGRGRFGNNTKKGSSIYSSRRLEANGLRIYKQYT